ncbi:MAG: ribonuclease HII [Candidatus Thorarchaeota archaeon]|nr:ribonuclease HII [Candidatus Thorarchaeota archaeon]
MPKLHGIAGVDEAGRGPLIGPMIICGVLVTPSTLEELEHIGIRDSKLLTPQRREKLGTKIESIADRIVTRSIAASEIDKLRKRMTMNEIEVMEFVEVVTSLNPQKIYLDAADVKASRFGERIGELSGLTSKGANIISEHKADSKYPIVSAASIIAKVQRDQAINRLHRRFGDFGSGYPSDPKTIEFVKRLIESKQKLPSIIRHSWDTVRKIRNEAEQTRLD